MVTAMTALSRDVLVVDASVRGLEEHDAGRLVLDRVVPALGLLVLEVAAVFGAGEELSDGGAEHRCEAFNFRQGQISAFVELE